VVAGSLSDTPRAGRAKATLRASAELRSPAPEIPAAI
jgi:hypothetical protein